MTSSFSECLRYQFRASLKFEIVSALETNIFFELFGFILSSFFENITLSYSIAYKQTHKHTYMHTRAL